MFNYQKNNRFFAQISEGLEEQAGDELLALGATEIKPAYRGVYFSADHASLYAINYQTRLCTRILAPLLTFDCHSTNYLHQTAYKLDWHELFGPQDTFAVMATVSHSHIKHSRHAALTLKDAVADYFRDRTGSRPNVDTSNPDILLNLHIEKNRATISLDTSGSSLHRRGYRAAALEAPMQETLAAAIIRLSGWTGELPLHDPMCGSGTLLAEALMHYCQIPAALLRPAFGFTRLPDFQPATWEQIRQQADRLIRPLPPGLISGADLDPRAVRAAADNLARLPHGTTVKLETMAFDRNLNLKNQVIVCNPPYGVRLGHQQAAATLLTEFGNFLKHRCTGSQAYIYLGDRQLIKSVGLKPTWKKPLKAGGLDGILARYDLY